MQAANNRTQFEMKTFTVDGKPRQFRIRTSLRTMFGREMPAIHQHGSLLEVIRPEHLLKRLRREYFYQYGIESQLT